MDIFDEVYSNRAWGFDSDKIDHPFYSGSGSHDPVAVRPYVDAVRNLLKTMPTLNLVDLGCGDFAVGSQIVNLAKSYTACDVVKPLIEFNRSKFSMFSNLEFKKLDIVNDELPDGDMVFLRQVLQHLSNEAVSKVLKKVSSKYQYLVFTDHLPLDQSFIPNLDMQSCGDIRLNINGSGLDLEQIPFNFLCISARVLCEVPYDGAQGNPGLIRTTLFELNPIISE